MFKKSILGLCLVFLTAQAVACCTIYKSNLYLGADAQWRHMAFHKNFGASVMRKNHKQGNIYMGFKLSDHWSVEIGRESTFTRDKQVTLAQGQVVNGTPLPADLCPATFLTSMKAKGPYAGLMFSKAIFEPLPLSFIGSLSLSHLTVKVNRDALSLGKEGVAGNSRLMKKGFLVVRPMAGVQYNCDNGFSLRASFSWLDTSGRGMSAKGYQSIRTKNKPSVYLKDSFVFGLGCLINI